MRFFIFARTDGEALLEVVRRWIVGKDYVLNENIEYRYRGGIHCVVRDISQIEAKEIAEYLEENEIKCAIEESTLFGAIRAQRKIEPVFFSVALAGWSIFWGLSFVLLISKIISGTFSELFSYVLSFCGMTLISSLFVYFSARDKALIIRPEL